MPYRVLWDSAQESILEWCYELKKGGFNPKTYLDLGASAGQILTVVERVWGLENIKGVLIDGNDSVQKVNWGQHTAHPFKGKSYENSVEWDLARLEPAVEFYIEVIGGKNEKRDFYIHTDSYRAGGSTLYYQNNNAPRIKKTVDVKTLDTVVGSGRTFDLVKMDTQGSELEIIQGAIDTFKRTEWIVLEANHDYKNWNEGAPKASEIIDWLDKELDFEYCGCIHSAREDGDHTFHNRRMEIEWK